MGHEHKNSLRNGQDFGFVNEIHKCVVDGCSEGDHSEVGAKMFCHLLKRSGNIQESMDQLVSFFPSFDDIKHHLLFTILFVEETETQFIVYHAGDGFIITQTKDDQLDYIPLDYGGAPPYLAYNYIDSRYLKKYAEGVEIKTEIFEKEVFKNVGVATDGLAYLLNSNFQEEFENYLRLNKDNRIKLLMNRIHSQLYDDITIAW